MNLITKRPLLFLGLLIIIWGVGYPVMKIGLAYAPPLIFAGLRAIVAAIFLASLAIYFAEPIDLRQNWPALTISTIFNVGLFFGLSTISVNYLPAGMASVLLYIQPIIVGLLAHWILDEVLTRKKLIGLIIGFIGVAIISYRGIQGDVSLYGVSMGLLSAIAWAIGTVSMKRANPTSVYWFIAIPFFIGGWLIIFSGQLLLDEHWSQIQWHWSFIVSLMWGSIIGLACSWLIWLNLIKTMDATRISANTFLVPVVSIAVSTAFLGEQLTWVLAAGGGLIIYSIYLVNARQTIPLPSVNSSD
ncbi:MAG: EamA family transporter [Immundisolibacteraceae bacterium]|nr:EamA family transporter [Immundisolibacteraceae bacterium]